MIDRKLSHCVLTGLLLAGLVFDAFGEAPINDMSLGERPIGKLASPGDSRDNDDVYFLVEAAGNTALVAEQVAKDHGLTLNLGSSRLAALEEIAYTARIIDARKPHTASIAFTRELMAKLAKDDRVVASGPIRHFLVAGAATHYAAKQKGLGDPYSPLQHSHETTRVTESHSIASGESVKVAIIDTGVDAAHRDLKNQIHQHLNFVGSDQTTPSIEFHATAVAGIIGAQADNGFGVIGVAPKSSLYALRACVETNPGSSRGRCSSLALARALDWAIVNEMQVINMSIHGRDDELVTRLIRKATNEGIVVVAATDLTHGQLAFPAKLPSVIAVSDQESNSLVGLAAHSQRIFIAPGEEILTTLPNDTFDFVTGSSFAAAHVTGIIALILEKSPKLSPSEVTSLLRKSVRVLNWGIIVDSCAALSLLGDDTQCRSFR